MKQNVQKQAKQKRLGKSTVFSRLRHMLADNLKKNSGFLHKKHGKPSAGKRTDPSVLQHMLTLRHDMRHQTKGGHHRQFPESESRVVQLLLFVGGIMPYLAGHLREKFHFRRKRRIHLRSSIRAIFERIRLHPAVFLSGALAVAAICALLSVFTVGVHVNYGGYRLGTVSGRHAVNVALSDIESITRDTLNDLNYTVDTSSLDLDTQIVPRRTMETRQELEQQLTDQLGLVQYAHVLYIDGEPVVATTYDGALEELLEQLKIGYITANTVECYFVENVEIREEYIDASYVMNLGYIAEILNETKSGEVNYTVEKGDAPSSVAEKFGMSLADLKRTNPGSTGLFSM